MLVDKIMKKEEVIAFINNLNDYEGYVQFSYREIDIEKDVFRGKTPLVENEEGFINEAHFANKDKSICIRQVNDAWLVSQTDIANAIKETFYGIDDLKINMAQIWEASEDVLCEGMEVMKLKKVVFAGLEGGEK